MRTEQYSSHHVTVYFRYSNLHSRHNANLCFNWCYSWQQIDEDVRTFKEVLFKIIFTNLDTSTVRKCF